MLNCICLAAPVIQFCCYTIQKHSQSVLWLVDLRWYYISPVRQFIYKIICNWFESKQKINWEKIPS